MTWLLFAGVAVIGALLAAQFLARLEVNFFEPFDHQE